MNSMQTTNQAGVARLWIIIGVVVVLLVGVGVGGYLFMEHQKEQDRKAAAEEKRKQEEAAERERQEKLGAGAEEVRDAVADADADFFECASSATAFSELDTCADDASSDDATVTAEHGEALESVETEGEAEVEGETVTFTLATSYSGEDVEEELTCEPDIEGICDNGEWENPDEDAAEAKEGIATQIQLASEAAVVRLGVIAADTAFFNCAESAEVLQDLDPCAKRASGPLGTVTVKYGDKLQSVTSVGRGQVAGETITFTILTDYRGEDYTEKLTCSPNIPGICNNGTWTK